MTVNVTAMNIRAKAAQNGPGAVPCESADRLGTPCPPNFMPSRQDRRLPIMGNSRGCSPGGLSLQTRSTLCSTVLACRNHSNGAYLRGGWPRTRESRQRF
jgi:hypothetical protein